MLVNQGMGSTLPTSALISSGVATAGTGVAAAASAGLLTAIGISAQAVPIIGTIAGGMALAIAALGVGNGCGAPCTQSTAIVNQTEPYMKQNVQAAKDQASANGGCLTQDEQTALLGAFDKLWNGVISACSSPQLGDPGRRCISDRQRGGKWDWFSYYRDPISSIPVCRVATPNIASSLDLGGSGSSLLLWGGLGLVAVALLAGGGSK